MFYRVLNTSLNTIKNFFPQSKVNEIFFFFQRLTFPTKTCQGRIYNPVKHARWSFLANIVNGFKLLTILAKKLHRRCSTGFLYRPLSTLPNGSYFWNYDYKQKVKSLNFGPKMSDLDIFVLEFEKSIAIIEISAVEFFFMQSWI